MNTALISIKKSTVLPEFMTAHQAVRDGAIAARALLLDIAAGNLPRPSYFSLPDYYAEWTWASEEDRYQPGVVSFGVKSLDQMRALRRYLGGRYEKKVTKWNVEMTGTWRGLQVTISCSREAVCEKVQDGFEEVEVKEIATEATYTITTERVQKYKWVCPDDLG